MRGNNDAIGCLTGIWFVVCAALGIGWLCLLAWAVISLVGWVTSQ